MNGRETNLCQIGSPRRGMTLVELLVTMAVGVVILGLALAIMIESDRATRKITRYQFAVQYCQQVMNQASATVRSSVAPSNITLRKNPEMLIPSFKKNEISMATFGRGPEPSLCRVSISTEGPEKHPTRIKRVINPIAEALAPGNDQVTTGPARKSIVDQLGGVQLDRLSPSIKFGYAGAVEPDKMPLFEDSWTSQGWPALIQITVRAQLDEDTNNPIELQTAVIPGFMPEKKRPAAADVKTSTTIKTELAREGKSLAQIKQLSITREAEG